MEEIEKCIRNLEGRVKDLKETIDTYSYELGIIHKGKMPAIQYKEIMKWCQENIGLRKDGKWVTRKLTQVHSDGRFMFYFKEAEDATAFKLRWM